MQTKGNDRLGPWRADTPKFDFTQQGMATKVSEREKEKPNSPKSEMGSKSTALIPSTFVCNSSFRNTGWSTFFPPKGRVDISLLCYPFPHFKSSPSIPFSLSSPPWQSCVVEQSNSTANWCDALNPGQTHMRVQINITLEISLGRDIFVILVGLFLRNEKNSTTGLTFFACLHSAGFEGFWRLQCCLSLPCSISLLIN